MSSPIKFPYAKPVYAAVVAFLTGLSAAVADDTITGQEWVAIALGTVVAAGAVLGVTGTEPKAGPVRVAKVRRARVVDGDPIEGHGTRRPDRPVDE